MPCRDDVERKSPHLVIKNQKPHSFSLRTLEDIANKEEAVPLEKRPHRFVSRPFSVLPSTNPGVVGALPIGHGHILPWYNNSGNHNSDGAIVHKASNERKQDVVPIVRCIERDGTFMLVRDTHLFQDEASSKLCIPKNAWKYYKSFVRLAGIDDTPSFQLVHNINKTRKYNHIQLLLDRRGQSVLECKIRIEDVFKWNVLQQAMEIGEISVATIWKFVRNITSGVPNEMSFHQFVAFANLVERHVNAIRSMNSQWMYRALEDSVKIKVRANASCDIIVAAVFQDDDAPTVLVNTATRLQSWSKAMVDADQYHITFLKHLACQTMYSPHTYAEHNSNKAGTANAHIARSSMLLRIKNAPERELFPEWVDLSSDERTAELLNILSDEKIRSEAKKDGIYIPPDADFTLSNTTIYTWWAEKTIFRANFWIQEAKIALKNHIVRDAAAIHGLLADDGDNHAIDEKGFQRWRKFCLWYYSVGRPRFDKSSMSDFHQTSPPDHFSEDKNETVGPEQRPLIHFEKEASTFSVLEDSVTTAKLSQSTLQTMLQQPLARQYEKDLGSDLSATPFATTVKELPIINSLHIFSSKESLEGNSEVILRGPKHQPSTAAERNMSFIIYSGGDAVAMKLAQATVNTVEELIESETDRAVGIEFETQQLIVPKNSRDDLLTTESPKRSIAVPKDENIKKFTTSKTNNPRPAPVRNMNFFIAPAQKMKRMNKKKKKPTHEKALDLDEVENDDKARIGTVDIVANMSLELQQAPYDHDDVKTEGEVVCQQEGKVHTLTLKDANAIYVLCLLRKVFDAWNEWKDETRVKSRRVIVEEHIRETIVECQLLSSTVCQSENVGQHTRIMTTAHHREKTIDGQLASLVNKVVVESSVVRPERDNSAYNEKGYTETCGVDLEVPERRTKLVKEKILAKDSLLDKNDTSTDIDCIMWEINMMTLEDFYSQNCRCLSSEEEQGKMSNTYTVNKLLDVNGFFNTLGTWPYLDHDFDYEYDIGVQSHIKDMALHKGSLALLTRPS